MTMSPTRKPCFDRSAAERATCGLLHAYALGNPMILDRVQAEAPA